MKKYVISALLLAAPLVGKAQLEPPANRFRLPGTTGSTVTSVVENILLTALFVVGIVTVAFLIYGGFLYITSRGNEEAAETAKKVIQNSIIGLIVVILSYVIVVVIMNALGPEGRV